MYKISVPLFNINVQRNNREKALKQLKRFDANRVFLSLDTYELDNVKREIALAELADNCRFFKENGYEVGAWIWTFWVKGNTEFNHFFDIPGAFFYKHLNGFSVTVSCTCR